MNDLTLKITEVPDNVIIPHYALTEGTFTESSVEKKWSLGYTNESFFLFFENRTFKVEIASLVANVLYFAETHAPLPSELAKRLPITEERMRKEAMDLAEKKVTGPLPTTSQPSPGELGNSGRVKQE